MCLCTYVLLYSYTYIFVYMYIFTVHSIIFAAQVPQLWSANWKINIILLNIIFMVCVFTQVLRIDPRK